MPFSSPQPVSICQRQLPNQTQECSVMGQDLLAFQTVDVQMYCEAQYQETKVYEIDPCARFILAIMTGLNVIARVKYECIIAKHTFNVLYYIWQDSEVLPFAHLPVRRQRRPRRHCSDLPIMAMPAILRGCFECPTCLVAKCMLRRPRGCVMPRPGLRGAQRCIAF